MVVFPLFGQETKEKDETEEEEKKPTKSSLETKVDYGADQMRFDVLRQTMYLDGNANVVFGEKSMDASIIELSWATNTVKAYGTPDSTGNIIGNPIFREGTQVYNAKEMIYNYQTEKGIIKGLVTEQGDGFVQGKIVKKTPENDFYIRNAIYTTCNKEHPHFGIRSSKLKMVPEKHVISGPFNLEVNNVPLPLGFPLGMFPVNNKRASGIIMPQYGEQVEDGFFLRNGGLYLAVNDYIGYRLTGDFYTLGGWGIQSAMQYKKRYAYNGNFNVSLRSRQVNNNDGSTEKLPVDYNVTWSHTPESRNNSRFSASVNIASQNFNRNQAQTIDQLVTASINSSIRYSTSFANNLFSLSGNLRHTQNTLTNIATMNPDLGLTMQRIYPFRKEGGSGKSNPLTEFNFNYSFNTKAELTNNPSQRGFPFTVAEPEMMLMPTATSGEVPTEFTESEPDTLDFFGHFDDVLENIRYGARHSISGGTNINLLNYFTLTPGFTYNEYWYPEEYRYTWVDSLNAVEVDTLQGLSRSYDYSTNVGMQTRFYMFYAVKGGIQVRHMITPSVSFSYRPDFGRPEFGMFQEVQTSENGNTSNIAHAFGGNMGLPGMGESMSMSFGLTNQLEAKVRNRNDTTENAEKFKKVTLIDNFSVNSSYNFAADSFNLSNFRLALRTTILQKLNINLNGTLDPYVYIPTATDERGEVTNQRRINRFAWNEGEGLGTLTQANFSTGYQFQGNRKKSDKKKEQAAEKYGEDDPVLNDIEQRSHLYVDFNIPWSFRFDYNLTYSKRGLLPSEIRQVVNFSGDFNFTEKWKFGFRSGYDFDREDFSPTNFTIYRDLHCWQMNLTWTPFGRTQGFTIDIAVRSSILQDLKISKRNNWFDRASNAIR